MSYLTVNEVATLLRVSDLTVRRWIWSGKLPATRVGRLLRIRQSDVDQLILNGRGESSAQQALRPGSAAALLDYVQNCHHYATPEDVAELERLIEEGCEQPGEYGDTRGLE